MEILWKSHATLLVDHGHQIWFLSLPPRNTLHVFYV